MQAADTAGAAAAAATTKILRNTPEDVHKHTSSNAACGLD
jgi:hypothetical protein